MVEYEKKEHYSVEDLRKIVAILRSPDGCPWDKTQTHTSLRREMLEEAYEAVGAIDEKDAEHLKEELGDVLLQVVFHASIEEDRGHYTLDDVADAECRKLIYRHPHVFGDTQVSGTEEVLKNWDELKKEEHGEKTDSDVLDDVPRSLPALWRAEKVQKKAAKTGFSWTDAVSNIDKLGEEYGELREAVEKNRREAEEELGDVLFATVKVATQLDIDPEAALHRSCDKYIRRFRYVELYCRRNGCEISEASEAMLKKAWQEARQETKQ